MKQLLKVNTDRCNKCGICAEVCPSGIIGISEEDPKTLFASACIACGHCVAVCPRAVLDHLDGSFGRSGNNITVSGSGRQNSSNFFKITSFDPTL